MFLTTLLLLAPGLAHALEPADVCFQGPVPVPESRKATPFDELNPPGQLAPLDITELDLVPKGGRYVDDIGRVYRFRDIERHVTDDRDEHGNGVDEFYHGGYHSETVYIPGYYANGYYVPGSTMTVTVPNDPKAYRAAKRKLRAKNRALRAEDKRLRKEGLGGLETEAFRESLCRYNQRVVEERAALEQKKAELKAATSVADHLAPGVPMSALALAGRLYEELGLDEPADVTQKAADADAVWAAVQRLGGTDEVTEAAKAAKAKAEGEPTLEALLAE
ncbi:MAG: hypothetical protein H6740_23715 [Alphaproteobacteria bacterium]|nr:hypothetical protein [Alphaproteobacteria bacterium]